MSNPNYKILAIFFLGETFLAPLSAATANQTAVFLATNSSQQKEKQKNKQRLEQSYTISSSKKINAKLEKTNPKKKPSKKKKDEKKKEPPKTEQKQISPTKEKRYNLGKINVSPNRKRYLRLRQNQSSFAQGMELNQREQGKNLPEILPRSVSSHVKRWGTPNSYSTATLRGAAANQVQIFLNGMPLANLLSGATDLASLSLLGVDAVEIYRGSVPVEFLSAPIGGGINLLFRPEDKKTRHIISTGMGSYNSHHIRADNLWSQNNTALWHHLKYEGSQGDYTFRNDNGTPFWNQEDDFWDKRENNEYNKLSQRLLFYKQGRNRWQLMQSGLYLDSGIPGKASLPLAQTHKKKGNLQLQAKVERPRIWTQQSLGTLSLFISGERQRLNDPLKELSLGGVSWLRDQYQTGARLGLSRFGEHWQGTIFSGVLLRQLTREMAVTQHPQSTDTLDSRAQRLEWRTAAQAKYFIYGKPSRPSFVSLQSRVISSYHRDNYRAETSSSTLGQAPESGHWHHSPALGLNYKIRPYLYLKSNGRISHRSPTFMELFGNNATILGNPELKAEQAYAGDIGLLLSQPIQLEYAFFYRKVYDMIYLIQNSQNTSIYQNYEQTEIYGHEARLSYAWDNFFELEIHYTYQKALDRSGIAYYQGNHLPYRPVHKLYSRLALSHSLERIAASVSFDFQFQGANWLDRVNSSYNFVGERYGSNLTFQIRWRRKNPVTFHFAIHNLFNQTNYDLLGYPLPRKNYYATLSYQFD